MRPGGTLVYSVCSFLPDEGEAHVAPFVAAHPDFAVGQRLVTWPHVDAADAFFAVALRRA